MSHRIVCSILITGIFLCAPSSHADSIELSWEERVACQEVIEDFYHHLRSGGDATDAPSIRQNVLDHDAILEKVANVYAGQRALSVLWGGSITAEHVQAEMDRIARDTRNPRALRALLKRLGNDPVRFAECLARPIVVDRLLRSRYASDEELHESVRSRASTSIRSAALDLEARLVSDASYTVAFEPGHASHETNDGVDQATWPAVTQVPADEWGGFVERAAEELALDRAGAYDPTRLREEHERFVYEAISSVSETRVEKLVHVWWKTSFDAWWSKVSGSFSVTKSDWNSGKESVFVAEDVTGHDCSGDDIWDSIFGELPGRRSGHTAVWTGSEMIIWGGETGIGSEEAAIVNSGGVYNPLTDSWRPTSVEAGVPAARSKHTAVWTGTEMIVWGGQSAEESQLGSGAKYSPAQDRWIGTSRGADAPSSRYGHTAIWTGTEMIVWGGGSDYGLRADAAAYDPVSDSWRRIGDQDAPPPRLNHTAIWTGNHMIVWGGDNYTANYFETGGVYDPAADNWRPTSTGENCPSGRTEHTAVWTGSEMIIWAGRSKSDGARYALGTDSWTPIGENPDAPPAKFGHTALWTGSAMIVFGGWDGRPSDGGATYDPAVDDWTPMLSHPDRPTPRSSHTAVWTGSEMLVFGGYSSETEQGLNNGSKYDPVSDSWQKFQSARNVPMARSGPNSVWTGAELLIWGGSAGDDFLLQSGASYDPMLDAWTPTPITDATPSGRLHATAVWTGSELIIWGGRLYSLDFLDDGSRFSPSSWTWVEMTKRPETPSARAYHTAVWTGNEMIVWGGEDITDPFATGGRYNPVADSWTPTSTAGDVPEGREKHTAVWTGSRMVVWGGQNASFYPLNSGGLYDPTSDTWSQTDQGEHLPVARYSHNAVWTGSQMFIYGAKYNVGRYDPAIDKWLSTNWYDSPQPSQKTGASVVWTGERVIVWGGGVFGANNNNGGRYDPTTDEWVDIAIDESTPSPRVGAASAWTGERFLVWGGSFTNDGATYCFDGTRERSWWADADVDGYGDPEDQLSAISAPAGYVRNDRDCDDQNPHAFPGAPEVCNGNDDDCNGAVDDGAVLHGPSHGLTVRADKKTIEWPSQAGADTYDVQRGDLGELLSSSDIGASVDNCLADNTVAPQVTDAEQPTSGQGFWYLYRINGCGDQSGTYDSYYSWYRDEKISQSSHACD